MAARVAFASDPELGSHIDGIFGTQGIIKLPKSASFELADDGGIELVTLDQVRDADRTSRGCHMHDGPQHCKLYRVHACTGDGTSCLIAEAMSRES